MKENLKQIKKEVESELNISYDNVTKSNDYILKDLFIKINHLESKLNILFYKKSLLF